MELVSGVMLLLLCFCRQLQAQQAKNGNRRVVIPVVTAIEATAAIVDSTTYQLAVEPIACTELQGSTCAETVYALFGGSIIPWRCRLRITRLLLSEVTLAESRPPFLLSGPTQSATLG